MVMFGLLYGFSTADRCFPKLEILSHSHVFDFVCRQGTAYICYRVEKLLIPDRIECHTSFKVNKKPPIWSQVFAAKKQKENCLGMNTNHLIWFVFFFF